MKCQAERRALEISSTPTKFGSGDTSHVYTDWRQRRCTDVRLDGQIVQKEARYREAVPWGVGRP